MSALTITTPGYLVASVPFLLGFMPEDSHVIIWLNDDGSVGLVQRTNLADADDPEITNAGIMHGFSSAICITFSFTRPEHFSDLHYDIAEALEESGVQVKDLMHYSDGRYWSYLTPKEDMIADPGTEIDEETLLTVRSRFAMSGMGAMQSRQAIIDEVTPSSGTAHKYAAARRFWKQEVEDSDQVAARYTAIDMAYYLTLDAFPSETDRLRVATSLEDVRVRDAIMYHLGTMDTEVLREVYKDIAGVVRVVPKKYAAPILTVAGLCAYLSGDGAKANVCVTTALEIDPEYRMAELMGYALANGIHPDGFRASILSVDVDEVLSGVSDVVA